MRRSELNPRIESEVAELLSSIARDLAGMDSAIGFALSVTLDGSLRDCLRTAAGAAESQRFFARAASQGWLEVDASNRIRARPDKAEGAPFIDLEKTGSYNQRALDEALAAAYLRTGAIGKARELMAPLANATSMPSREQFARLSKWSALLDHAAYRCATRLSGLLDVTRPQVLQSTFDDFDARLIQYWATIYTMANMTLLSANPAAGSWLSDMAVNIQWTRWTPTFPLLRERTLWFAASAARSAISFGPKMVGKYLQLLSQASHPMNVFDALFGLSAIALDHVDISRSILSELRSLQANLRYRDLEHAPLIEAAFTCALRTISAPDFALDESDPEVRALGWHKKSGRGMATPHALRADPASVNSGGRFLGLAVLPFIVRTSTADLYPMKSKTRRGLGISLAEMMGIVHRAWGPKTDRTWGNSTLH